MPQRGKTKKKFWNREEKRTNTRTVGFIKVIFLFSCAADKAIKLQQIDNRERAGDIICSRTANHSADWHYLAGQLRVCQNYFHGNRIFLIGQNNRDEGVREQLAVKSADGHRPWLLSECEMPKPDCSLHPEGTGGAGQHRGHQKQCDKTSAQTHLLACAASHSCRWAWLFQPLKLSEGQGGDGGRGQFQLIPWCFCHTA